MTLRNSNVAVIGLGAMGLPIAINLGKSGTSVQVWNRSKPATVRAVAEGGVTNCEKITQIDAAIVLTVLPDLPQVDELLAGGLEAALHSGDILVVMGTVSPVGIVALGQRLAGKGIRVVDAPLSGGDVGAWKGELSIMTGGAKADHDALVPTFEKIGKTIRYLGPLGSGEMAKACNQIVVAATLTALAEAVTLGRKAGLDTTTLLDILAGGLAGSQVLQVKREKIESSDFTPGGSAVFQLKDLRFALEAGLATGTALPMTSEVAALYTSLVEAGDGALDHSSIVREIERRSN